MITKLQEKNIPKVNYFECRPFWLEFIANNISKDRFVKASSLGNVKRTLL